MKNLAKLDKFYLMLAIVLLVLSVVVIITARSIFEGINTASAIDPKSLETDSVHIDQSKLDAAIEARESGEFIPLDLR